MKENKELNSKKILIVAAHPDDEVLGCGGAIARHVDEGDKVQILIMAEGATSRQEIRDRINASTILSGLANAANTAAQILGADSIELLDLPDNRLDSMDRLNIIKKIEDKIVRFKPNTVYVHHSGDVNVDHRRIHEAVVTACRPTPEHCVKRLLSYEVASSTEWQPPNSGQIFQPNWFIDISEQWDRKKTALDAYVNEMRRWPHSRSIEAVDYQTRWRGAQVGVKRAEAFCLLRNLR